MHKTLTENVRIMIERDGWYVVHIKAHKEYACPSCLGLYNGGEGREPNPRCVVCLGTGYLVTLAPLIVRASESVRPDFNEQLETQVGITGSKNVVYYALPEAELSEGDLFAEVTWSVARDLVPTRGSILAVHKIFEVNELDIKRGQSGEFAYFRAATHSKSADVKWISDRLSNRPLE